MFLKIPTFIQKIYSKRLWRKETDKKVIYLTFDDGPTSEITDWVLETLDKYKAKATFFSLGKNLVAEPELALKIFKNHQVGNHTFSHLKGWKTAATNYIVDIAKAQKVIDTYAKVDNKSDAKLFRPPYGKMSFLQAKKLRKKGYTIVMWDVLSGDYNPKLSKEKSLENLLKNTKKGSIVVFHDSKKAFNTLQYILPKALETWSKESYTFDVL